MLERFLQVSMLSGVHPTRTVADEMFGTGLPLSMGDQQQI